MKLLVPTFACLLATAACFISPLCGEVLSEPVDLIGLDAWEETGEWALAGSVAGSAVEKAWESIEPGEGILYNGADGETSNPVSKVRHGDVEIEAEFMIPKSSNSGLYLMQRYEVQILDSYGKPDSELKIHDAGAIYERWDEDRDPKGYEGTPPATNASGAPGTWQNFRIVFRAPRFDAAGEKTENARFIRVELNGTLVHEDVEVTGPTRGGLEGPEAAVAGLKVQGDHGPVAFRKLRLVPMDFD